MLQENTFRRQFHDACEFGHRIVASFLLARGAAINQVMNNARTPLFNILQRQFYNVCKFGHRGVANFLLARAVDINEANSFGATPLWIACCSGHREVVELLLDRGADINQATDLGTTPLHIACANGHREVVEFLLDRGADINRARSDGVTPLAIACKKWQSAVADLLLARGADINWARFDRVIPRKRLFSSNKLNGYTPEDLKFIIRSCVEDRHKGRANAKFFYIIAYRCYKQLQLRCYKQLQLHQERQAHMLFGLFSHHQGRRVENVLPEEVWRKVTTYLPLIGPSYTPSDQERMVIDHGRVEQERQTHTLLSLFFDHHKKRVENALPKEVWGKMTTYLPLVWLRNDDNITTQLIIDDFIAEEDGWNDCSIS